MPPRPHCTIAFSAAVPHPCSSIRRGLAIVRQISSARRFALKLVPTMFALLPAYGIAHAQASPTASRAGDLQVGVGYVLGQSNYGYLTNNKESLRGFGVYSSFDFKYHFGAEFDLHQTTPSYGANVYERTYEIGGRYRMNFRRFVPYGKVMYGRGVFNYPNNIANLAYNLYTLGAGSDYRLTRSINLRADYEHQHWMGFPVAPLQPNLITIGVAYHFHD